MFLDWVRTSIGDNSYCSCCTTRIRFFTYGKLWEAENKQEHVTQVTFSVRLAQSVEQYSCNEKNARLARFGTIKGPKNLFEI